MALSGFYVISLLLLHTFHYVCFAIARLYHRLTGADANSRYCAVPDISIASVHNSWQAYTFRIILRLSWGRSLLLCSMCCHKRMQVMH